MGQRKTRIGAWAASGVAVTLLLSGCGQSAVDAGQLPAVGMSADLNGSVPAQYKAAAESGQGWVMAPESPGDSLPTQMVGDFLVELVTAEDGGELAILGINANTGQATIEATLPGTTFASGSPVPDLRPVAYQGKHYVTFSSNVQTKASDGLTAEQRAERVYWVEMTDGAEPVYFDLTDGEWTSDADDPTADPWMTWNPSGENPALVPTPDGLLEFDQEDPRDWEELTGVDSGTRANLPFALSPDGEAIRSLDGDSAVDATSDGYQFHYVSPTVMVGDWSVFPTQVESISYWSDEEASFNLDAPSGFVVYDRHLLFRMDTTQYYVDLENKTVKEINDEDYLNTNPVYITASPNGRYLLLEGTSLVDTETLEVTDFSEDGDRLEVYADIVTDDGVVFGTTSEGSVQFDATTGDFSAEETPVDMHLLGVTSQGTLVSLNKDYENMSLQGIHRE